MKYVSPFTKKKLKNTIFFSRFVKGAMNIIDLLGILPYFMSLLLNLITVSGIYVFVLFAQLALFTQFGLVVQSARAKCVLLTCVHFLDI